MGLPGADCPLPLQGSHSSWRDLHLQKKPLNLSGPSDQPSQHWRPSPSSLPPLGPSCPSCWLSHWQLALGGTPKAEERAAASPRAGVGAFHLQSLPRGPTSSDTREPPSPRSSPLPDPSPLNTLGPQHLPGNGPGAMGGGGAL